MNLKEPMMRGLSALMVLMVITSPVAAASPMVGASAGVLGVDLGVPNTPDDVVRHTTSAQPGIIVTLETSEDVSNLKQWANSSADRTVVREYQSTNAVLVAAPPSDIRPSLSSLSWALGNSGTITGLSYVKSWSWDRRVEFTDPITNLETSDTFEKPDAAWYAELASSGEYEASGMAWDGDAPDSNLTHTRGLVGADGVQADGQGVDVAVIDSAINIGNGTLYGNGTEGSDMRVTDAYDFVQSEEPNLTAPRSELPAELAKVGSANIDHGSWVSSSILNAKTGVAPKANLMAYRALNDEGSGSTSDIRAAIDRANQNGADIIVMSLGSPVYSEGMADALKHALSEDGNVTGVFVAVGNSYTTTRYVSSPGDVSEVIGVTATNAVPANVTKKAYFANTGPDTGLDGSSGETNGVRPDTSAPGMAIAAPTFTAPGADGGRVTDTRLSGTSMAAPIAGGVGALLLDAEPGLMGEPTEFRTRIVNSGNHTPKLGTTQSVGGRVDADRAINGYSGPDAPDRTLDDETSARDRANTLLSGDTGQKLTAISGIMNKAL